MDSTLPHLKDSRERSFDVKWTLLKRNLAEMAVLMVFRKSDNSNAVGSDGVDAHYNFVFQVSVTL